MNKPGEITLLGKDGVKWLVSLLLEKRGRMSLGKGWKDFAKANGLKTGDSITLESIWENATPVLSLLRVESSNDSEVSKQSGNKTRKAENRSSSWELEKRRSSSSSEIQNRTVILTLTPEGVRDCKLVSPSNETLALEVGLVSVYNSNCYIINTYLAATSESIHED